MPLIDGTYEILRQQPVGDGRTLVHATDPDGRPVRIVWYDVAADNETSFERYRRSLRRLARDPDVLLREVVSRPGARYAVWDDADAAPRAPLDAAWRQRLEKLDLPPDGADLRKQGRTTVLAGLGWDEVALPPVADGDAADDGADAPGGTPTPWLRALPPLDATARSWLLGALLTLSAAGLVLVGWARSDNDRVVEVPELAGLPAEEAAEALGALRLEVVPQALATGGPPGTVVSTDPAAGAALRPGRQVRLDYVLPRDGSATREVPALTGRPVEEAESRLRPGELTVGDIARVPARLPAGTVLAQRPAAGVRATPGSEVHLVISEGPRHERSFLPDLVGRDVDEARELARLAGLSADRVLVDAVRVTGASTGEVVGMTPAPWHPLRVDDVTLRLLVADPDGTELAGATTSGTSGIPDVVGLPPGEARERLENAGHEVRVERTVISSLPDGVVLQDPEPGAPADGAVRLTVNARPVALPEPRPVAEIQSPRLRWIPYRFLIEPGIPPQDAELIARTVGGDEAVVLRREVIGGDVLDGTWPTLAPGPIVFELSLNGLPYAESRVTREVDGP